MGMASAHLSKAPVVTVVDHSRTRKWTKDFQRCAMDVFSLPERQALAVHWRRYMEGMVRKMRDVGTESRMSGASAMKAEWVTSRLYVETGRT